MVYQKAEEGAICKKCAWVPNQALLSFPDVVSGPAAAASGFFSDASNPGWAATVWLGASEVAAVAATSTDFFSKNLAAFNSGRPREELYPVQPPSDCASRSNWARLASILESRSSRECSMSASGNIGSLGEPNSFWP